MSSGIIKFLDPKTDVVFKKVFGSNPNVTKSFLNALLPFSDDRRIESVSLLPNEQLSRFQDIKNMSVSARCSDQAGNVFNVEIQFFGTDRFRNKLLYRASEVFGHQVKEDGNYSELYPVYGLGIINAIFEPQTSEWFHHYKMANVRNQGKTMDSVQLIFLELPKFISQSAANKNAGILWLRFLKEVGEDLKNIPEEFQEIPEIMQAMNLVHVSAFTPEELDAYYQFREISHGIKTTNSLCFSKEKEEKEEKAENKAYVKQEIVKKLLAQNLDIALISLATGLSLDDILHIKAHNETY